MQTSSPTAQSTTTQSTTTVAATSSTLNAGEIAGCVVGSVVFLAVVVLCILLFLRARKRKRTPPSSEFMNSIRAGAAPVLRLDSGAEYTPTLPEKGPAYTHPLMENAYYTSPPMLDMKIPDEVIDIPSARPSVEKPLHPQRFSSPQPPNDAFRHHPSSSVGSRRELWGSDAEMVSCELSPVRRSPAGADSVLQFAPRFSMDASQPSHSPPSLHPLRRKPDLEGI